jgi:citrate lyase synthetase
VLVVLIEVLLANQDSFLECFLQLQKLANAKQRAPTLGPLQMGNNRFTNGKTTTIEAHARCYCCTRKLFCM